MTSLHDDVERQMTQLTDVTRCVVVASCDVSDALTFVNLFLGKDHVTLHMNHTCHVFLHVRHGAQWEVETGQHQGDTCRTCHVFNCSADLEKHVQGLINETPPGVITLRIPAPALKVPTTSETTLFQ